MHLKILLPAGVQEDTEIIKLSAEAENGHFTLLPRHIDFVSALMPGLCSYLTPDGREHFLALDEGILVKQGQCVYISCARAIAGDDLSLLEEQIAVELKELDENEKKTRSVMARLEADTLRRFTRLKGEF